MVCSHVSVHFGHHILSKQSIVKIFRNRIFTHPLSANSLNCSSFWKTFCRILRSSSVRCAVNWSVDSDDDWWVRVAIILCEWDAILALILLISGPLFGDWCAEWLFTIGLEQEELVDIAAGDGLDIIEGVLTGEKLATGSDGLLFVTIWQWIRRSD